MVLAAMANPPEHDFAPSWLKIPSDQQKRGQKLGASDQWSSSNKSSHQQTHDDGGSNKSRHRHYSSTDSSHPSGSYGRSPSSSSSGPPQGGYGYRGREPDRRHYPRPGSGSRHHSVDDLNGFQDYGGWNIPPQYSNGFYTNYPRRGSTSASARDGPQHFGNSRYGDVFHQGGRGYYSNGGGSGGGRGGSTGRQRYHSGSRAGYSDRDSQQEGSSSSHGGDDGHSDVTGKKKEGGEDSSKTSALFSNDFPSLIGDNSKSSDKDATKTCNTPAGVWENPLGSGKVQISGRKVQLIKKSIHNDLPPRNPSTTSSAKSSGKTSSSINSEGSKVRGHIGSGTRVNPPSSVSTASSSSSSGGYKHSTAAPQKASLAVKVNDTSGSSSMLISPKPATKDSSINVTKDSNIHSPKSTFNPPKHTSDVPAKPSTPVSAQPKKTNEKAAILSNIGSVPAKSVTKDGVSSSNSVSGFTPAKKNESKAGPSNQTQANGSAAKPSGKEESYKPVLVDTTATTQKPVAKQVGGKVSPTKPVLVQTLSSATSKPTMKPMSVKSGNGKPALKESAVRPVPVQIKTSKFSGKESPIRPFPVRPTNPKQGNRDRSVRPGPVQIKSSRLVGKETPPIRPVPVHIMTRKSAAKDNPSDAIALTTRSVSSSFSPKEKQAPPTGPHCVNTTSTLAKEPSINPTLSPPMDVQNPRYGLNKNVNNSDRQKEVLKGLQNGGDNWAVKQNGPLRIEDAETMNCPQHSTRTELQVKDTPTTDRNQHLTSNGLDNEIRPAGRNALQLSSSLEAEKRLLQEMGWHEHSDNEEGYAPITEDEMKEFQRRSQQLKRNGTARSLPVAFMSSSLPNTPMTSIDLDDALSSCSSDSSEDDL